MLPFVAHVNPSPENGFAKSLRKSKLLAQNGRRSISASLILLFPLFLFRRRFKQRRIDRARQEFRYADPALGRANLDAAMGKRIGEVREALHPLHGVVFADSIVDQSPNLLSRYPQGASFAGALMRRTTYPIGMFW